jgi:hypothetical protein
MDSGDHWVGFSVADSATTGFAVRRQPAPSTVFNIARALSKDSRKRSGYQRKERPVAPKLGAFFGIIHQILQDDRDVLKKQRHTAKRNFERLRVEHQYDGGYTVVREFVAKERLRQQNAFIPFAHPPGHVQVNFGEADIYLCGVKTRVHYFCMDLPQPDAILLRAYPAETTDAHRHPLMRPTGSKHC